MIFHIYQFLLILLLNLYFAKTNLYWVYYAVFPLCKNKLPFKSKNKKLRIRGQNIFFRYFVIILIKSGGTSYM